MNSSMMTLVIVLGAYSTAGLPTNLATLCDGAEITKSDSSFPVDSSMERVTRCTEGSIGIAPALDHAQETEPAPRIERAPMNILHYVDFGGHTGENGAFGWYADFPAHL